MCPTDVFAPSGVGWRKIRFARRDGTLLSGTRGLTPPSDTGYYAASMTINPADNQSEDEIVAFVYGPGRAAITPAPAFSPALDYYSIVRASQNNLQAVRFVPSGGTAEMLYGASDPTPGKYGTAGDVADNRRPINGRFKISRANQLDSSSIPGAALPVNLKYIDSSDTTVFPDQDTTLPRSATFGTDYQLRILGASTYLAPVNRQFCVTIPLNQNEVIIEVIPVVDNKIESEGVYLRIEPGPGYARGLPDPFVNTFGAYPDIATVMIFDGPKYEMVPLSDVGVIGYYPPTTLSYTGAGINNQISPGIAVSRNFSWTTTAPAPYYQNYNYLQSGFFIGPAANSMSVLDSSYTSIPNTPGPIFQPAGLDDELDFAGQKGSQAAIQIATMPGTWSYGGQLLLLNPPPGTVANTQSGATGIARGINASAQQELFVSGWYRPPGSTVDLPCWWHLTNPSGTLWTPTDGAAISLGQFTSTGSSGQMLGGRAVAANLEQRLAGTAQRWNSTTGAPYNRAFRTLGTLRANLPPATPTYQVNNLTPPDSGEQLARVLLYMDETFSNGLTPHNSAAYGMTTNGFVCGSVEIVGLLDNTQLRIVKRPVIWAPSGGDASVLGMLRLDPPASFSLGLNSELHGISIDQRRDPSGLLLVDQLTSQKYYQITAVGSADTARTTVNSAYVGINPHAIVAIANPNYSNIRTDDWSVTDLNDSTLIKNSGNAVLTDAIAINREGYILAKASDGNMYLLVPLVY